MEKQAVLDDLTAEWYNMLLFASQDTLEALRSFIQNADKNNLSKTASAMRKDLGRGIVSIEI
jgi:hypothetical protein